MKLESLVIVDKYATVNLCSSLVHTARHVTGAINSVGIYIHMHKLLAEHIKLDIKGLAVIEMKS